MIGFNIGPVRLQLGPVASILISDDAYLLDFDGFKEEYKSATFGYQAGHGKGYHLGDEKNEESEIY